MDYQQSREYVRCAARFAGPLGLKNITELMNRMGNPQDSLRYVQVAGTNGKGSVIAYLDTCLKEAGYRVGRYISPSVYFYREKFAVSGEYINRERFAGYVTRIAGVIDEMTRDGLDHPTPFEIETAVAFLFFAEENCDLVLLETGMGGRDDATNIVRNTLLAVLTPISLDHQDFLGKSLAEIADKKAGILKPGCAAVSAEQPGEAEAVIRGRCRELAVPLTIARAGEAQVLKEDFREKIFLYRGEKYSLKLTGVYQTANAVLALAALEALAKKGFPVDSAARVRGMHKTGWDGRFTVLCERPLFLVDGAHNPAAADVLEASVKKFFPDKKLYYIMGVLKDKDYPYLIDKLCPIAREIVTIETPDNIRALSAEALAEAIRPVNTHVRAALSIEDAVKMILSYAEEDGVILAFGSLSFIGELTAAVRKLTERQNDDAEDK